MATQRDWAGVPELTDDAAIISSSFISELPLSQTFRASQSLKNQRTPSFSAAKENENASVSQTNSSSFRNLHKRAPVFRPPLIDGGSQRKKSSESVYYVPTETNGRITQSYVPPYRSSINIKAGNNHKQFGEDSRLPLSGRPSKQQSDVNQNMLSLFSVSTQSDSESEFDSPASQFPSKRLCFQFSQAQGPNISTDRNIHLSSQSQRRPGHSLVANSEGHRNDTDASFSTPHVPFERINNPDSGFCDYKSPAETLDTPASLHLPNADKGTTKLRSVEEIPLSYRDVFEFPYFNMVQSMVLDDALYTDKPLVVSAPTGAGKTVIFELAIIRLLATFGETKKNWKIVYVAPIKALCSERYLDWKRKFQPHGLNCMELTGDTEMDSIAELHKTNLILTTPEKWDSMSRKWKDNRSLFQMIVLFLTDEIHILNDSSRGSTVEAVISRMKTLRLANKNSDIPAMRFVAVSATIPNIEDIATWLGCSAEPASSFNLGEKYRPVKLMKIVVGYPFKQGSSDFRFDMNLAYRLKGIIETYSNSKPTLVFCSSRKSVEQTADVLKKEHHGRAIVKPQNREAVQKVSHLIREGKVADRVRFGIGVHHAGLGASDRKQVEELFRKGLLPVLVSTSTLAMGVNLPAHLVVIKSTVFYSMGTPTEYSDSQVLQMIGRAGRPQFDTSATAVIMTKSTTKSKYESLVNGTQKIESSLHKQLIEHLNAEVVLHTITDMALAVEWIRHTFLYVRVMKNPTHYGYPFGLDKKQVEKRLEDLCLKNLNELAGLKLVNMDPETYGISPTETGKLMARYCIAFNTMEKFHTIDNEEGAKEMLDLIVSCSEFDEFVQLRNNEKSTLNALNKNKNKEAIRYPMNGRIKTKQMKTNCLIQAQLSCLPIHDFSLSQDVLKIFRVGQRVAKCLMEFLWQRTEYHSLLTAIEIYKSIKTKLWVDSKYVAKQLDGIGPTMSQALVNAGITSFQKLEETNPRELELIVNRHPPFGNQIRDAVAVLPKYEMSIEQLKNYKTSTSELVVSISLVNRDIIETKKGSTDHQSVLLIGNQDNTIVFKWRIIDSLILRDLSWKRKIDVTRSAAGPELFVHLISQEYVGLDIHTTYVPVYLWSRDHMQITNYTTNSQNDVKSKHMPPSMNQSNRAAPPTPVRRPGQCQHKCFNKDLCRHKCCKDRMEMSRGCMSKQGQTMNMSTKSHERRGIEAQIRTLKNKVTNLDVQPGAIKRQRMSDFKNGIGLQQFSYQKPQSMKLSDPTSEYQQAPASFQNKSFPKPPQSILKNLPIFRYGVGGRRREPGPHPEPRQAKSSVELGIDQFDDQFDEECRDAFEDNFVHDLPLHDITNVDNNQRECDQLPRCNHTRYVQDLNNGNDLRLEQTPDSANPQSRSYAADMTSYCDLDGVFESDDSLDSIVIQEVPSAQQSRHQTPQHFSQDAWAELSMYQQDREASFDDDETFDPQDHLRKNDHTGGATSRCPQGQMESTGIDQHINMFQQETDFFDNETFDPLGHLPKSDPTSDPVYRCMQQEQMENTARDIGLRGPSMSTSPRGHFAEQQLSSNIYGVQQRWPTNSTCSGSASNTTNFLATNESDDDLCYAEEMFGHELEVLPEGTSMSIGHDMNYSKQHNGTGYCERTKNVTTVDNSSLKCSPTKGYRSSCNQFRRETSKSPVHRFGQVVAWVADSDSSPISQKSNPKCRTPLTKTIRLKSDFHKKCTPKSDTWVNSSDELSPDHHNLLHDVNNLAPWEKDVCLPKRSSFFHIFGTGKSDDIAEVSGNIFAGVF